MAAFGFRPFSTTFAATFVSRPNRFLVRCEAPDLGEFEAFLPNPGRMWELLLPGAVVHIAPSDPARGTPRKTRFTCVAVERDGLPVFLHTHANNAVARHLIELGRLPGLEGAEVVRAETTVGRNRFDFLLRDAHGSLFLEVKSCTLFGNGVAMFPDAVTARGRRHLLELAAMARGGVRTAVAFMVHSAKVTCFMPDYHTDLAFSRAMLDVRGMLPILPVSVAWRRDLSLGPRIRLLDIPWAHVEREAHDRGAYLCLMRLPREVSIEVGGLGAVRFRGGWHVYVGSAMAGLDARLARHARLTKKPKWHIDYLRAQAAEVLALPVRSSTRLECPMAQALADVLERGPAGFGCSDCACPSHLYYSPGHPLQRRDVHRVLERFRMRMP